MITGRYFDLEFQEYSEKCAPVPHEASTRPRPRPPQPPPLVVSQRTQGQRAASSRLTQEMGPTPTDFSFRPFTVYKKLQSSYLLHEL